MLWGETFANTSVARKSSLSYACKSGSDELEKAKRMPASIRGVFNKIYIYICIHIYYFLSSLSRFNGSPLNCATHDRDVGRNSKATRS